MGDELTLAQLAAAGDVDAFRRLVERHEGGLRNFLERLAPSLGDDLAQESFARAWRYAGSWRGETSYRSWLYRIGWRVFLNSRQSLSTIPFDADLHAEPHNPDPATSVDVHRALSRLSEKERAAAILCYGEGCSHAEAASALGIPLGSLKTLAARARVKLIDFLETDDDG